MTSGIVHRFCRGILESGDLSSKLAPPPPDEALDATPDEPWCVDAPARDADLALDPGAPALPKPDALGDPEARAACLARFAHHELMAVELFAWALLRWPTLPVELRRGWLRILGEEQQHCRLYLERLAAHGSELSDHPTSGYFWKQAPAMAASPEGPRAFLAGMGLTLEQANLDFSLIYRDGFRKAGDAASADVCERIHDDEIGHVRFARTWLLRLTPGETGDVDAYLRSVPFPLSGARAKARRFDVEARRRAGLSPELIDHVRTARSSQQTRPRSRSVAPGDPTAADAEKTP